MGEELIVEVKLFNSGIDYKVFEMKITNRETKETLPKLYHKFKLDKGIDKINDLSSNNGTYTIECNGIIVYKMIIKDGKIESTEIVNLKSFSCTFNGIVECVVDTIEEMPWYEYGLCEGLGSLCIASVWASCIWIYC